MGSSKAGWICLGSPRLSSSSAVDISLREIELTVALFGTHAAVTPAARFAEQRNVGIVDEVADDDEPCSSKWASRSGVHPGAASSGFASAQAVARYDIESSSFSLARQRRAPARKPPAGNAAVLACTCSAPCRQGTFVGRGSGSKSGKEICRRRVNLWLPQSKDRNSCPDCDMELGDEVWRKLMAKALRKNFQSLGRNPRHREGESGGLNLDAVTAMRATFEPGMALVRVCQADRGDAELPGGSHGIMISGRMRVQDG